MLKGIDTSEWQGNYNFGQVAAAVDFVITRAGFGVDRADYQFATEFQQARQLGKLRGSYWYVYPNEASAEQEAGKYAQVLTSLGPLQPNEVAAIDFEEAFNGDPVDYCLKFLNELKAKTGLVGGVYASLALFKAHNFKPVADAGYWCWVASWGVSEAPAVPGFPVVAFWQYTDKLVVPGIVGPVDGDVFLGDAAAFHKYGLPGATPAPVAVPPTPANIPRPTPPTPNPDYSGQYVVKGGDTLSAIAAGHGVSLQALEAANPQVTNPNVIYVGQVIHIPGGATTSRYTIQSGDTLSGIATKFGHSLGQLEQMNPQIQNPNLIYPGEIVNV
jgi:GH25 family lysozyme M1 (1,4-beta-N-acetylmuramidase)/LysM repeat protein